MSESSAKAVIPSFLNGGGEMGKLIRSKDWSSTSLGNPTQWPQSLRTALSILLNSKFPMFLFWGPDLVSFYNDAFRPSLGKDGKHPHILGMPGQLAWAEIWDVIKPMLNQVLSGGEAIWRENQLVPFYRNGRIEDIYWTFSYSSVRDETDKIAGVFVTCAETTNSVANLRRLEESERSFRTLINEAPVPAALYRGRNMVIEMANTEVLKLWGKDKSVIGKKLIDILPELESQPFIGLMQQVFDTGKTYEATEIPAWIEKDGKIEIVYFNLIYTAVRDAEGNIDGILAMGYDVSNQMEVRKQISQLEERTRLAVDAATLGTFDIDLITGKSKFSKRFFEIYGFEVAHADKEDVIKRIHPDDKLLREEAHKKAEITGLLQYEARVVWPNEMIRWVNVHGKYFFDNTKKPVRYIGIVTDITDQKESIQKLAESEKKFFEAEERLRIAVEASELGTFEVNYRTKTINYSQRYLEILGFEPGDHPTHEELLTRVHPDDISKRDEANQRALESGMLDYELRLVPAKNKLTWIRAKGKVTYDENGKPFKMAGGILDITNEKLSRQLIEESEERFRSLANSVPQHVWTTDADGMVNYFNQSMYDYTGLAQEQLTGDGWVRMIHPDDREQNLREWNNSVTTGEPYLCEHRFLRHDGEYRWHLSRALPQYDNAGTIALWVGTSTDIDDIKKHEQQKDDFIKMASHELKTPVTSIKGYIQLLQKLMEGDPTSKPAYKTYLVTVDKQISKLTKLITDLLDITRIETGILQLNKNKFSINDLVHSIATDMQLTAPSHKIIVQEKAATLVVADQDRISQVLINYITNAIKYSPTGDRVVLEVDANHREAIVSVTDYGIGIHQPDQAKVFERFYRAPGINAQNYPGFGIGLFIVQEIIARHHGKTWVVSEKGKGSTFYFSLPLNEQ
ncbi:MAG TPA: PAS domain-containing protein [Chitinophagaceae bacterium]|nr:PAS domain-containing protein [Chitinophagaceae bacterium]